MGAAEATPRARHDHHSSVADAGHGADDGRNLTLRHIPHTLVRVRFGVDDGLSACGEPHAFDVLRAGKKLARVEWSLLGEHNQQNALATIAAAEHAGVAPELAARALASFENVKRRMELRGEVGGVKVYDDFAHHPTAIRTTVDGLRRKVGKQRILAVFEPRSNTMKLGTMKSQLPWSLENAEPVLRTMKGWKRSTVGILEDKVLPQEARDYIDFLEQEVGAPITLISTGPRREETLLRDHADMTRLTAGRLGRVLEQR